MQRQHGFFATCFVSKYGQLGGCDVHFFLNNLHKILHIDVTRHDVLKVEWVGLEVVKGYKAKQHLDISNQQTKTKQRKSDSVLETLTMSH